MEFYVSSVSNIIDPSSVSSIVKVGDTSLTSSSALIECDELTLCLKTSFNSDLTFYLYALHKQIDPDTHLIKKPKYAVFKFEYDKFSIDSSFQLIFPDTNYTGEQIEFPFNVPETVSQTKLTNVATLA